MFNLSENVRFITTTPKYHDKGRGYVGIPMVTKISLCFIAFHLLNKRRANCMAANMSKKISNKNDQTNADG